MGRFEVSSDNWVNFSVLSRVLRQVDTVQLIVGLRVTFRLWLSVTYRVGVRELELGLGSWLGLNL